MAPVKIPIDLQGAKSNEHLSLFVLRNFTLEFNTADCSLSFETFSVVSSVTLLHIHVCLFAFYLSGHSALSPLWASPSLCNFILGLLLYFTRDTLSGVISRSIFLNTNFRMMPPSSLSLALVSLLISRLIYPTSDLTLLCKCLIIYFKFQCPIQQDLWNLPLNHILNPRDWTNWVLASGEH